jgi:hypothetical protein
MKRIFFILLGLLLVCPTIGLAAGSAVHSVILSPDTVTDVYVITSHTDGTVSTPTLTESGLTTDSPYLVTKVRNGLIKWVEIIPGTGGDAPTAFTTLRVVPTDGTAIDFLGGMGDGASVSANTAAMPLDTRNGAPITIINRALTISATGLGDSNKVTIKITTPRH